jgi:hemolysin III
MEQDQHLVPPKPLLRGVLHEIAFFVSLATGPALVVITNAGTRLASGVYSLAMSALFGISALYHRGNWRPPVRRWLRKLDHSMILVFIAATFTPIAVALGSGWARIVLVIVWVGALLGVCVRLLPISMPKPVAVIPYLVLGWFSLTLLPESLQRAGVGMPLLLLLGGSLFTAGAVTYARRRPDPSPRVFGYHEVFHALVVVAVYLHYGAVALTVA